MTTATATTGAGGSGSADWHVLPVEEAIRQAGIDPATGLGEAEVAERRARHGPNRFAEQAREPRWRAFARQYADPMQLVLLAAGIFSIWPVGQLGTGLGLIALTVFNALLGLSQEGKAEAAVAALQAMMIVRARVRRGGQLTQVPAEELVPGDVVALEAGELVPADGRLIRAATLEVAEAPLTGESLPVSKGTDPVSDVDTPLGDRLCMAYMNTNVTRGSGEMVVTSTGMATEVGRISGMLQDTHADVTPLTRQMDMLTRQILVIAGFAIGATMLLGLARGNTFDIVFVGAIAFAVSSVPTGLPTVVTTILSLGTQTLAQSGAIVKRLRSVETLGATTAVNSDKTGTLTLNQMTAVELAVPGRRYTISGSGYSTEGRFERTAGSSDVALDPVLEPMVLCSDAVLRGGELIGDPTEGALVVLAAKAGVSPEGTREAYPRLAELPFDSAYKFMATFHRMTDEDGRDVVRCFVKGAPDQLLTRAGAVLGPDLAGGLPLDDRMRELYQAENERLGAKGLRVMATARKDFDPATFDPAADLLPLVDGLTLLALVGIVDPPRPSVKPSIAQAKAAGIQVRMITGDHAITAAAIARDLGIEGRAITGAEFEAMSDEQAMRELDDIGVIARVAPEDKVRLVDLLRRKGNVVAMTGDGVNDAPALKAADIGVAMGITGTEVSKQAAVMILTDDDFSTIVKAVALGRSLYDALTTFVRFQMGVLLGFIVTFLGAGIFGILGGVPFVPLQSLWLNFTTDMAMGIGLGMGKPSGDVMARPPRPLDAQVLPRPVLAWLVLVGLAMGALTLGVIWWAEPIYGEAAARTMGFTTFGILHLVFALTTKDERESVFGLALSTDRKLVIGTLVSVAAIVLASELPLLQRVLRTTNLDTEQWLVCIALGLAFVAFSEIRKRVWDVTASTESPSTIVSGSPPVAPEPTGA
jgi:P-type Ca2+ transporter type 2C